MSGRKELDLRIVNNHIIELDAGGFILFCHTTEGIEEKTITKLHDVGFVNASNFLA